MNAIAKKDRILILAGAAGLLAAGLGWFYLHTMEHSFQEAGEAVPVLIANRYIPKGTVLLPAYFQQAVVPKSYVQPGAVHDFAVLVSSGDRPRYRALIPLQAGAQVSEGALIPLVLGEGISQVIPTDRVAVSFAVDKAHGVGGLVRPGDLINILHTPKNAETESSERVTSVLFEAIPVVAVDKNWKIQETPGPEGSEKTLNNAPDEQGDQATVLSVLLNPLAAVRLEQAQENETLSVALRAQGDDHMMEHHP